MTDPGVGSDHRTWVLAEEGRVLRHFSWSVRASLTLALRKVREVVPAHAEHVAPGDWDGSAQLHAVERSSAFGRRGGGTYAVPRRWARGDEGDDVIGRTADEISYRDDRVVANDHAGPCSPVHFERTDPHQPVPPKDGA